MTDIITFTDQPLPVRSQKQHYCDILREYIKRKIGDIADDAEKAQDYCRQLMRENADVSDELDELETTVRGLLLVTLLLKRESEGSSNG